MSWDHNLPSSLSPSPLRLPDSSHLATPTYTPPISSFNVSPAPNTRERKNKVKKAPPPPSGESGSSASSSSPLNLSASNHQKTNSNNSNHEASFLNSSNDSSPPQDPSYPSLPVHTKEHHKGVEIGFDKLISDNRDTNFLCPVPAPRTLKPALPNKPEGISR